MSNSWEEAYLRQSHDAAMGRLFHGLVHNLNGILQAFSMEGELFSLFFSQADKQLAAVLAGQIDENGRQQLEQVQNNVTSRAKLAAQMKQKVQEAQDILHHTRLLVDVEEGNPVHTAGTVIRTEVEFLLADPFFKHRIQKELQLAENLPPVRRSGAKLHQAVFALLANACDALRGRDEPRQLTIEARVQGGDLFIAVQDNGPGIEQEALSRIWEPFFTTRPGHEGLGLYLASRLVADCGGTVACSSQPGQTRFVLTIPEEGV